MKIRTVISTAVFCNALAFVPTVSASTLWHLNDSEIGYEVMPQHADTGIPRSMVTQDLAQAKANTRDWNLRYRNLPTPAWTQTSTTTREQVRQQMESMSPAEQARLDQIYAGG